MPRAAWSWRGMFGGEFITVLAMARVLVTGMSGAGKTTVLNELRRRVSAAREY